MKETKQSQTNEASNAKQCKTNEANETKHNRIKQNGGKAKQDRTREKQKEKLQQYVGRAAMYRMLCTLDQIIANRNETSGRE